jgi:hypothetical protein
MKAYGWPQGGKYLGRQVVIPPDLAHSSPIATMPTFAHGDGDRLVAKPEPPSMLQSIVLATIRRATPVRTFAGIAPVNAHRQAESRPFHQIRCPHQ